VGKFRASRGRGLRARERYRGRQNKKKQIKEIEKGEEIRK